MKKVAHTMCSCGKLGFDERVVDKALGKAQAKRGRQMEAAGTRRGIVKMESRTYQCEVGDLHHLTSESRREYNDRIGATTTAWDDFLRANNSPLMVA